MTGAEPVGTDGIASTPGLSGYVLAVGVSWLPVTVGSGVLLIRDPSLMLDWTLLVGLFALGTAPFGVLVVHLACERFDAQWVHVAAAGLFGGLAVLLADSLLLSGPLLEFWRMALGVGVCTALGHATVIPLVPVVRRRFRPSSPFWRRMSLR